jgi:Zn-finger protein
MKNSFKFFLNKDCKYYPCHKGIKELNCLFCFCPLYQLKECGGNYKINEKGIKECTDCIKPHVPETGYERVINKLKESTGH